jgi:serine/threonine-protein kinase
MGIDVSWLISVFPDLEKISQLGEGGQKWVFSCFHPKYKKVVLKLIKPGAEQRLDREIEAVRRLNGYVPTIYEVGLLDSPFGQLVWILEEYISGNSLAERLIKETFDKQLVLRLTLDLLSTVADAESKKIVHRDIKPDNIKIDDTGRAWLLDFGIARILDMESKTKTDAVSGPHSPGYGAPEQFRNKKHEIDNRADLFAIGITIYESVTGNNPFLDGSRDRLEVLRRVEHMPLPMLKLGWDKNGVFADFVSSLTQKYSYQRPRNCKETLDWFREIAKDLGEH